MFRDVTLQMFALSSLWTGFHTNDWADATVGGIAGMPHCHKFPLCKLSSVSTLTFLEGEMSNLIPLHIFLMAGSVMACSALVHPRRVLGSPVNLRWFCPCGFYRAKMTQRLSKCSLTPVRTKPYMHNYCYRWYSCVLVRIMVSFNRRRWTKTMEMDACENLHPDHITFHLVFTTYAYWHLWGHMIDRRNGTSSMFIKLSSESAFHSF